jgi:hypothetical protein
VTLRVLLCATRFQARAPPPRPPEEHEQGYANRDWNIEGLILEPHGSISVTLIDVFASEIENFKPGMI